MQCAHLFIHFWWALLFLHHPMHIHSPFVMFYYGPQSCAWKVLCVLAAIWLGDGDEGQLLIGWGILFRPLSSCPSLRWFSPRLLSFFSSSPSQPITSHIFLYVSASPFVSCYGYQVSGTPPLHLISLPLCLCFQGCYSNRFILKKETAQKKYISPFMPPALLLSDNCSALTHIHSHMLTTKHH